MDSSRPYDFDRMYDRRNTASYKWDQSARLFGREDVIPMWVADMDFPAPPEVVDALTARAAHGIYGYTIRPQSYYDAIMDWLSRRHNWNIRQEWITASPGVVVALSILVDVLTEPGEAVILQAPVYYPFYDVIRMNGRQVVNNALVEQDGKFVMNFGELEKQMAAGAKMILLCSPHNPGGRVWTEEELRRLGELALKYGVIIVSDEIHNDLVFKPHRHIPIASLSEELAMNTVTCIAPSKTFNLPGLQASNVIIPNPQFRHKYNLRLKALSLHMESYFGGHALETAYRHGEPWLEALLDYLRENLDALERFFAERLPECRVMRPEGTYLVWVDCRAITPDPAELKKLMFEEAGVAFSEGSVFGDEGRGFARINIACPRSLMLQGLERFAAAVDKRRRSARP
jgi:cystathionine beta-lyase